MLLRSICNQILKLGTHGWLPVGPGLHRLICRCPDMLNKIVAFVLRGGSFFQDTFMNLKLRTKSRVPTVRSSLFVRELRSPRCSKKRDHLGLGFGYQCIGTNVLEFVFGCTLPRWQNQCSTTNSRGFFRLYWAVNVSLFPLAVVSTCDVVIFQSVGVIRARSYNVRVRNCVPSSLRQTLRWVPFRENLNSPSVPGFFLLTARRCGATSIAQIKKARPASPWLCLRWQRCNT